MKKMYLMKGMAVLALGLIVASCNKMDFDQDAYQKAKEAESRQKFINNVMGGQDIDPNQTWATTVTNKVTVNSEFSGTLRLYTANPHGTKAAALYTQDIQAGSYEFTITKPQNAEQLYAKLTLEDGSIRVVQVDKNGIVEFTAARKSGVTTVKAPKRAARHSVTFPDAPDWSTIPTSVPGTAIDEDLYYNSQSGDFFVKTSDTQINVWNGNANLYFAAGTYNITSLGLNKNTTFYLLPGANVTFSSFATKYDNVKVYVASGATFNGNINSTAEFYNKGTINSPTFNFYNANTQWNQEGCGFVYNQGTIECATEFHIDDNTIAVNDNIMNIEKLVVDEDAHFENKGTLTIDGHLGVENNNSTFYNNGGTVTAASTTIEGSADMFNDGTMTISGTTLVNSNDCTWHNDGTYTTSNFTYQAGSGDVINNCKLFVTNKFYIGLGDGDVANRCFQINGGGSVQTVDFEFSGPGYILMGSNAIFKVTGTATMGITSDNLAYGIYGVGDDYAVFQANSVVKNEENNHHYVTYGGNLWVASDSHFANGHDGGGMETHAFYFLYDNAKEAKGQNKADITIPAVECSIGYTPDSDNGGDNGGGDDGGDDGDDDDEPIMYYYYVFEDLGAIGDFDFNDVVLRVSSPVNNVCTVDLMAAGGTLKSKVVYGDQTLCNEVHEAFEVELGGGNFDMVNTGYTKRDFVSLGTVTIAEGADMANLPFGIVVTGNNGESVKVTREVDHKGTAPLMIVVNGYPEGDDAGKWFWAKERVNISVAYPDFGAWGANVEENQDWYLNYVDDSVWKY